LLLAFQKMGVVNPEAYTAYTAQTASGQSPMHQDLSAYSDAMKTVATSKESIVSNNGQALGTDNYFSSAFISNIFSAYAEGGVFVYALYKNGEIQISSTIDTIK